MAAQSNSGFQESMSSALNWHAISFQSGAINSTSGMIPMGNYFGVGSTTAMLMQGNSSIVSNSHGRGQSTSSPASLLLDSVPGLTKDAGLAVEWSVVEQYKLEEGLATYADEPSIMRYIKVAATLRDKTVRDVALRCRWMMRKRRKPDHHNAGKKVNTRKDKLAESSSKINIASVAPMNIASYSLMMHQMDHNERALCEVPGVNGTVEHLLEQNAQAFNQITANFSTYKLQDNIDLFCHTRNNITSILHDMSHMPGIMRHMPPLPLSINNDLANSILPNVAQPVMFDSPSGVHMKQEPRC